MIICSTATTQIIFTKLITICVIRCLARTFLDKSANSTSTKYGGHVTLALDNYVLIRHRYTCGPIYGSGG